MRMWLTSPKKFSKQNKTKQTTKTETKKNQKGKKILQHVYGLGEEICTIT